jgi:hypothetical protein
MFLIWPNDDHMSLLWSSTYSLNGMSRNIVPLTGHAGPSAGLADLHQPRRGVMFLVWPTEGIPAPSGAA